jgi:hypothetical protein
MAKINSFRDVIEDMFYNDIFNALSEYVESNPNKLECSSYSVEYPDEATLSDMEVKLVNITNYNENGILFDVVVSAEVEIAETVKRNRDTDGIEQWFRISCSAELEDGLEDFAVLNVYIYNKYRSSKENNLSEYLVPIIYKEQLDDVAERFLEKYYPEALIEPMAVPTREVAKRMGLEIQETQITKNCTVFGQIYFSDCEIQCYDSGSEAYKPLNVKKGSILVDPNVYFMRTVGSMNNTIIHECVHWYLHKKFFEIEKLYNKDARSISCQVQEGIRPERNRTPLDWMEWHANSLAPRILMPAKQTKQKIEELIAKNKRVLQNGKVTDIMESVVFELSEFFEVSRIAAKIRMIDLGYTEAIGVYTYIDNHYILSHAFERSALKNNQTFSIGMQDSLYEYATNVDFKKLLDSGKYVYVDAHFCINDSKYIRQNENGYAELTDYARQHIDECCLIFDIKARKNNKYGTQFYTECVLFKSIVSDTIVEAKYSTSAQNFIVDARAEELKKIGNSAKQLASIMRWLPTTFADTLVSHMDRLACTEESLAEKSLIHAKTIQRMRNDLRYKSKLETVIAICIGLQLHPILSTDLVGKAGFALKPFDEEHIIYQMLLTSYYQNSIYECNEILRANNCKALGKEE